MFFRNRLIISYIQEPEKNRFLFQLAGGEKLLVTQEEFITHWRIYREFEAEREAQHLEHYRPLPITLELQHSIKVYPVNVTIRRKRQSA